MNIKQKTSVRNNEQGLVAIVVTMLIMIILTLIVTGFAQMARREQRQALDRQLAAQALYAAESGINEGRRVLKAEADNPNFEDIDCATEPYGVSKINGTDDNVEFTCLLIKTKLPDLKFDNVLTNKSLVTPIMPEPLPGRSLSDKITISWQNSDSNVNNVTDRAAFVSANSWGRDEVGVLRIELVPMDGLSSTTPTFTAYLWPSTGGDGQVSYSTAADNQGKRVNANCREASKRKCFVTINDLIGPALGVPGDYYLRMRAIYNPADVHICADNYKCSGEVLLPNAQSEIDSTGRANDVLKRLQVRVNNMPDYAGGRFVPEYSVDSSDDICKLYSVFPNGGRGEDCSTP